MNNHSINLFGSIKDKKLILNNKQNLNNWLSTLNEDDDVVVKFYVSKQYKSNRQLRLLYSCFRTISAHIGHSVDEVKILMKTKAGVCFSHTIESENITVCKSLSDFSKKELSEFVQFVDLWSTEHLNLPLLSFDDKQFLKS